MTLSVFMKATSAFIGCNDAIVLPKDSVMSDWEVELGVVIGSMARHVSEAGALTHVAMPTSPLIAAESSVVYSGDRER